jgi:hypothetical protein
MSRWYYESQPAETLRLTALATSALSAIGVAEPRRNIMIVRKQDSGELGQYSVATILVSRQPFTPLDIQQIGEVAAAMQFLPVVTPLFAERPEFGAVTDSRRHADFVGSYPLNIEAPTDDTPFFFHMLRAGDLLRASTYQGMNDINLKAIKVLGTLLAVVSGLSLLAIVAPLALRRHVRQNRALSLVIYFAAIGLGFMMVEIGQLERLIVFLGHPIYGLTVVLFILLVASSLGSLFSSRFGRYVALLPLFLLVFIAGSPLVTRSFVAQATPVRFAISAALLFPSAFFMGMAFPLGMKYARHDDAAPAAWYWGINGAFSVISSVLAVVVAVFWGVTATLLVGLASYVIAFAALYYRVKL